MDKPDANARYADTYFEFSEKIEAFPGCSPSLEAPKLPDYKVAFVCPLWTGGASTQHRWYLPMFQGKPVPKGAMKVRVSFPYDKNRVAEAVFTLRPPS